MQVHKDNIVALPGQHVTKIPLKGVMPVAFYMLAVFHIGFTAFRN